MKRFITLVCLVLLALISIQSSDSLQAQDASESPYIYYYSELLNSFVIERADGSESRLFGDGEMPDDITNISGPGWSPSGEWFAWTSTKRITQRNGHTGYVPHVLNQNGTSLNLVDDMVDARLAWSPTEDLLMVVGVLNDMSAPDETGISTVTIRFALIDAANETMLGLHESSAQFIRYAEGEEAFGFLHMPSIYWTPDGGNVLIQTDAYANDHPFLLPTNLIFDREGNLHEAEPVLGLQAYGGLTSGYAVYPNEDATSINFHSFISGEATEVSLEDYAHLLRAWHPSQDSTFVLAIKRGCEMPCGVTTLAWEPGATSFRVVGESAPMPPFERDVNWSPDGDALILTDAGDHIYVADITTGAIEAISSVGAIDTVQWTLPNRLMIEPQDVDDTIYEYNVAEQSIMYTFNIEYVYFLTPYLGQWSPDGTTFAYVNDGLVITDTSDGSTSEFRPDGRSYFSIDGGDVVWDESGEWLLMGENAVIAGGGRAYWTSVANRDGSVHREMGYCDTPVRAVCYGWLPSGTDTTQLPPARSQALFPTPSQTIHATDWSFVLSWSPDGTQLMRGARNLGGELGPSTVFDVETGEAIAELDPMNFELHRVGWTENDDGTFAPQVVEQPVPAGEFGAVVFATSPDGTLSAEYGSEENSSQIGIYNVENGELLHAEVRFGIAAVSFSPDNSLVIISSPYARAILYDGTTWEPIVTFNTSATAVAFSPDGETLAIANSWDIELYAVDDLLVFAD